MHYACSVSPFRQQDAFNIVLSYIAEKNKSQHGRVVDYEMSLKICLISREFRRLWVCSPSGPFKFSAKEIKEVLGDSELSLRSFLGALNQELIERVKHSFRLVTLLMFSGSDKKNIWIDQVDPDAEYFGGATALTMLLSLNPDDFAFKAQYDRGF